MTTLSLSPSQLATGETADLLYDVADERIAQVAKWGVQARPDGTSESNAPYAEAAKAATDKAAENGTLTWADILSEEVLEAFSETNQDALREELVQVAAVAISWAEDIDRRRTAANSGRTFYDQRPSS